VKSAEFHKDVRTNILAKQVQPLLVESELKRARRTPEKVGHCCGFPSGRVSKINPGAIVVVLVCIGERM
jgi:hypothetical protein